MPNRSSLMQLAGCVLGLLPVLGSAAHASIILDFNTPNQLSNFNQTSGQTFSQTTNTGVYDQPGPTAGGAISPTGNTADGGAIYKTSSFDLTNGLTYSGNTFSVSLDVKAPVVNNAGAAGSKVVQLGFSNDSSEDFLSSAGAGNRSFVSARLLGDGTAQFQTKLSGGTTSSTATSSYATLTAAGTKNDWFREIFTATETSSGKFNLGFSIYDVGATGVTAPAAGNQVFSLTYATPTAITPLGGNQTLYAGFRVATANPNLDNFTVTTPVVPEPASLVGLALAAGMLKRRARRA